MANIRGFINETIIYGAANVFARFFGFMLIPLYTNFFSKSDYSNLIMLQSIFTVLSFLLALNSGVFYYYFLYEKIRYRKIMFTSWFYYQIIISLAIIFLLTAFSYPLSSLFIITEDNFIDIIISIISIGLLFIPFSTNNTLINYFRIRREPKSVLILILSESALSFALIFTSLKFISTSIFFVFLSQVTAKFIVSLFYLKYHKYYLDVRYFSLNAIKKLIRYAWPFFTISSLSWTIISLDKFIGVQALNDKDMIAILAFASQLILPMNVLIEMTRQALGPYVMSTMNEKNSRESYQKIFDLSIYVACIVGLVIIGVTPVLTYILANQSYLPVLLVIPLFVIANILSVASNQFSVSFGIHNKTKYIALASFFASISSVCINFFLMRKFGFLVSGFSQIISYLIMSSLLFYIGINLKINHLHLQKSLLIIIPFGITVFLFFIFIDSILNSKYHIWIYPLVFGGILGSSIVYFKKKHVYLNSEKLN